MVWCRILLQAQVWSSWKLKGIFIKKTLKHHGCGWSFGFRLWPDEKHVEVQAYTQIEGYFRFIFWPTYPCSFFFFPSSFPLSVLSAVGDAAVFQQFWDLWWWFQGMSLHGLLHSHLLHWQVPQCSHTPADPVWESSRCPLAAAGPDLARSRSSAVSGFARSGGRTEKSRAG